MSRMNPIPETLRRSVLSFYGLEHASLFADGAEAEVYERDEDTLLKLYIGGNEQAERLEILKDFYANVSHTDVPLPMIQDIHIFPDANLITVIETRLRGRSLAAMIEQLQGDELERAENLYLDVVFGVQNIQLRHEPARYHLIDPEHRSGREQGRFEVFYAASLREKLREVSVFFASYDEDFPRKAAALVEAIESQPEAPLSVVHGDLFAGNILVNEVLDRVEGVIDFGTYTQFGNALLDIAGGFGYYRMYAPERRAIRAALLPKVLERLSREEHPLFFQYLLANAILTSNLYTTDPDPRDNGHFQWSLNIVLEEGYWEGAFG